MRFSARILAVLAAASAWPAWAQDGGGSAGGAGTSGANITVQLPNFSVFGVNTSVLVPDSGPSPLAAQRQARYSRTMRRGLTPQQTFGAQRAAAVASVTAQIHDPQQADEALLRAARARRTNWVRGSTSRLDRRQPTSSGRGLQSIADIERGRAGQVAAQNREARALITQARQAAAEGKSGVALIYYNRARRQATGELAAQVAQEIRALELQRVADRQAARAP